MRIRSSPFRFGFGILLVCCATLLVIAEYRRIRESRSAELFAELKLHCRVFAGQIYENAGLKLRLHLRDDLLACDYLTEPTEGPQEVFVWRRNAFYSSVPLGFGTGILGEITANPAVGLQSRRIVATTTACVAGTTVLIKQEQPASCVSKECPLARVAELEHDGIPIVVEEYSPDAGLFSNLEWMDAEGGTTECAL